MSSLNVKAALMAASALSIADELDATLRGFKGRSERKPIKHPLSRKKRQKQQKASRRRNRK